MQDKLWTIEDVARHLRLNRFTVYRLAEAGELPGIKVARRWRFKSKDIEVWFDRRKKARQRKQRNLK
jgi:excisionase family DNA binding protein